jgi:transcriptional regulator with XRE-family HTH domain
MAKLAKKKTAKGKGRGGAKKVWTRINLEAWRLYRGFATRAALADKTAELFPPGVSEPTIAQIENRKSAGSPESLELLAKTLDCSVGELFDVKPEAGGSLMRVWVPEPQRSTLAALAAAWAIQKP